MGLIWALIGYQRIIRATSSPLATIEGKFLLEQKKTDFLKKQKKQMKAA